MSEIVRMTARQMAGELRSGGLSAREVTEAHLSRIEQVDGHLNAICTAVADRALARADQADRRRAAGEPLGLLHGIPIVHKDLLETAGVTTTYGCAAFVDHVPTVDALVVSRCADAGSIMLGKSNTPQFGTGGHTSNAVFGTTRNPWDVSRTAGGSSGGSAAALAGGMAALATGTDMAGSLRIPASFCNVVGMRPSPGRVPFHPTEMPWFPYAVAGPMGRTVGDVAMLLAAVAGPHRRAPLSLDDPHTDLPRGLEVDVAGWRVGWAPRVANLPVDDDVMRVLEAVLPAVRALGVEVEAAEPDLSDAGDAFLVWRSWYYATQFGELYRHRSEVLDPSTVSEIERGLRVTGADLGAAERGRSRLYQRAVDFFEDFDILLMPCTPVSAFPAEQWHPTVISGQPVPGYLDWMRHLYYVTATSLPCLSLPVGFTDDGAPVGIQVVSGPRQDLTLLRFAYALERALGNDQGAVASPGEAG